MEISDTPPAPTGSSSGWRGTNFAQKNNGGKDLSGMEESFTSIRCNNVVKVLYWGNQTDKEAVQLYECGFFSIVKLVEPDITRVLNPNLLFSIRFCLKNQSSSTQNDVIPGEMIDAVIKVRKKTSSLTI